MIKSDYLSNLNSISTLVRAMYSTDEVNSPTHPLRNFQRNFKMVNGLVEADIDFIDAVYEGRSPNKGQELSSQIIPKGWRTWAVGRYKDYDFTSTQAGDINLSEQGGGTILTVNFFHLTTEGANQTDFIFYPFLNASPQNPVQIKVVSLEDRNNFVLLDIGNFLSIQNDTILVLGPQSLVSWDVKPTINSLVELQIQG